jgi:hypothetical protein
MLFCYRRVFLQIVWAVSDHIGQRLYAVTAEDTGGSDSFERAAHRESLGGPIFDSKRIVRYYHYSKPTADLLLNPGEAIADLLLAQSGVSGNYNVGLDSSDQAN